MPTVHVVGCGGTIASEPAADGAAPAKAGAELVDAVPAVSEHADLRVTDVGSRPRFDMDFGVVAAAAEAVRDAADYADVPVVHSGTGVDGSFLEWALDAGADGAVVEGTGLGNATGPLGDAVADAAASVPVVVSSRCHAGPTEAVYGTAGGGVMLRDHGVAYAGDLSTAKARVKLVLGLTAGLSRKAVVE